MALAVFGQLTCRASSATRGGLHGEGLWISWLSPLGWVRFTRAFADENWWVFGLAASLIAVLVALAYALSARRDIGAGLLPPRLGPAAAAPRLRSPLALAWRRHRGTLLAWMAGAAVFGVHAGLAWPNMSKFVDSPQLAGWLGQMGARDAGDAFLFIIMYVLGQVVAVYAMMAVLEMRAEEVEGRAEALLATPVGRLRWAGSHLFFALIGPAVVLAVLGLLIGLGYGLSAGDVGHELPRLLARTMAMLPAAWVMAGLAAALYGLLPRFTMAVSWGLLALFFALELGWELQQISQPLFNISPFAHVHWAIQVTATPLVGLTVVAAALTAIGLIGFQRRDLG